MMLLILWWVPLPLPLFTVWQQPRKSRHWRYLQACLLDCRVTTDANHSGAAGEVTCLLLHSGSCLLRSLSSPSTLRCTQST